MTTVTKKQVLLAAALAALILVPAAALAAAGDREEGKARSRRGAWKAFAAGRREGKRGAFRDLFRMRRRAAVRGMERLLDAPDDQVRAALEAARAAAPVRERAREEAAASVLAALREARDASPERRREIREALRAKVRVLRDEAAAPLAEAGKGFVATLTPEQRGRIEARAKARGRTVDDAALARWSAWRLSRPGTMALLKARLGDRPAEPR